MNVRNNLRVFEFTIGVHGFYTILIFLVMKAIASRWLDIDKSRSKRFWAWATLSLYVVDENLIDPFLYPSNPNGFLQNLHCSWMFLTKWDHYEMARSRRWPSGSTPTVALAWRRLEEPQPAWSTGESSRPVVDLNCSLVFLENIDCKDCFSHVLVDCRSTRSLGVKKPKCLLSSILPKKKSKKKSIFFSDF